MVDVRKIISINTNLLNVNMLQWVRTKVVKLGFNIIKMSDYGSNRKHTFVTIKFERSNKYKEPIRKLKHDDTKANTWIFNVICDIRNHILCYKLIDHSIVFLFEFWKEQTCLWHDIKHGLTQKKYLQFWKVKTLKVSQILYMCTIFALETTWQ